MTNNIFEARAEICYCVPNGASACAPCRERRAAKDASPNIIGVDFGKEPSKSVTVFSTPRQYPSWIDQYFSLDPGYAMILRTRFAKSRNPFQEYYEQEWSRIYTESISNE